MEKKISNIKDRVIQFIDYKGFKREDFFNEMGLSYSNFKGPQKKSALNSDSIDKILSKYPEININWLVLGVGPMTKTYNLENKQTETTVQESSPVYHNDAVKDERIRSLEREIELLREMVDILKAKGAKAPEAHVELCK